MAFAAACPILAVRADGLVQFPPAPAAWTVDIVPYNRIDPAKPPETPPDIKKIDITRVGDVCRNVITWATGKITERWGYDKLGVVIVTETVTGRPAFMTGEDIGLDGEYAIGFDAAAFSWLSDKLLKDEVLYNGKKCLHYQNTIMVDHTLSTPNGVKHFTKPLYCEAWIAKETLFPVAMYDGRKLGVFTFHDPPAGTLTPPHMIQKQLEHYIAASQPLK